MSSITFPNMGSGHHMSASTSSTGGGHHERLDSSSFYAPSFDGSSFQMNPHSQHPPRTSVISRPSTAASSVYGGNAYETKAEVQEKAVTDDGQDEEDEAEIRLREAKKRVPKEEIWRDLLITSNGRDKAFKIMQYSIRLYLLFHVRLTGTTIFRKKPTRAAWETELFKRLESTASGFSFTRRLLIMFNWLPPLVAIMERKREADPFAGKSTTSTKSKGFLHHLLYTPPPLLLELVNGVADDLHTSSRLGLLSPKTGERAGRFADWCWFLSTLVGLVENGVERSMISEMERQVESRAHADAMTGASAKSMPTATKIDYRELRKLQEKQYWLRISQLKLFMDLTFVSYDLFQIRRGRNTAKTLAGFAAALLSTSKLYNAQRNLLARVVKY